MEAFRDFWDGGDPLVGDEGGLGWLQTISAPSAGGELSSSSLMHHCFSIEALWFEGAGEQSLQVQCASRWFHHNAGLAPTVASRKPDDAAKQDASEAAEPGGGWTGWQATAGADGTGFAADTTADAANVADAAVEAAGGTDAVDADGDEEDAVAEAAAPEGVEETEEELMARCSPHGIHMAQSTRESPEYPSRQSCMSRGACWWPMQPSQTLQSAAHWTSTSAG